MSGMAGDEDGDAFLDDDFFDIPDDELRRLEQDAISFTQQASANPRESESRKRAPQKPSDRRSDAPLPNRQFYSGPQQPRNPIPQHTNLVHAQHESFDSTILDEDGLPLVTEERAEITPQKRLDETAQREQWRLNRFAQPQAQGRQPAARGAAFSHGQRPAHAQSLGSKPAISVLSRNSKGTRDQHAITDEESLRRQVAELLREKEELAKSLSETKDEVSSRRGEVANLRAKQSDEHTVHQRQIAALQKLKQEEADKHAASIQAMNAENAKVASEIQFLKQELKDESRKTQALQRQLRDKSVVDRPNIINTTPKRNNSLRDGFDDDEMMVISPVKSGRRSKQGTPTANRKRKQPAASELNVPPLVLRLSGTGTETEAVSAAFQGNSVQAVPSVRRDRTTKRHLRLIQKVMSFRPYGGSEVLVECLAKMSLPSDKPKTFSLVVVEATSKLEGQRLPGDLLQIFLDLWSKALKEKYHTCLRLLMEVVNFILDLDPFVVDKDILANALPVLQNTISVNARVHFNLMKKEYLSDLSKSKPTIDSDVNTTYCLSLLHTIACLCTDDAGLIGLFWRIMDTDFILMMINTCQPVSDLTLTLQLVATSILPDTFGNICGSSQQGRMESYICDRICYLLWEAPKPDSERPLYSRKQVLLRLESLDLLAQLTLESSGNPLSPASANNHGTTFLVNHPSAIARLVRSIYDELAAAYQMTPLQSLHIRLVNTATRILHFLWFSPAGREVDLQSKLTAINGGAYKYRVVMNRLAFAEGTDPGIDAGITQETVRMATEMLEESITPDEVDDLVKVFEGSGGTTGRNTTTLSSTQN